jgi:hypothetical protein
VLQILKHAQAGCHVRIRWLIRHYHLHGPERGNLRQASFRRISSAMARVEALRARFHAGPTKEKSILGASIASGFVLRGSSRVRPVLRDGAKGAVFRRARTDTSRSKTKNRTSCRTYRGVSARFAAVVSARCRCGPGHARRSQCRGQCGCSCVEHRIGLLVQPSKVELERVATPRLKTKKDVLRPHGGERQEMRAALWAQHRVRDVVMVAAHRECGVESRITGVRGGPDRTTRPVQA